MNNSFLSLIAAGLTVPLCLSAQTIVETFESYALGVQSANAGGNFTIIDGGATFGTGQAAQITSASMTHRFAWDGDPQPVITVSFDFFNGSANTEAQPLRFAFNQSGGGLMTGTNNIVRLAMLPAGTFDFEATLAADEVYMDASYPLDTAMTLHMVLNVSNAPVSYASGGVLAANSIELWKEIGGVLSHVGYAPFAADRADSTLHSMGFATNSSFGTAGDFIVDNLRWSEGVAVVPEPSTYAMIAGLLALGLMLIRRRNCVR